MEIIGDIMFDNCDIPGANIPGTVSAIQGGTIATAEDATHGISLCYGFLQVFKKDDAIKRVRDAIFRLFTGTSTYITDGMSDK